MTFLLLDIKPLSMLSRMEHCSLEFSRRASKKRGFKRLEVIFSVRYITLFRTKLVRLRNLSIRLTSAMLIKSRIRTIPDFPRKGVMFYDITTLLQDATGFRVTLHKLVNRYSGKKIHKVAAIESRGFIVGAPLSYALGAGFVPLRKKGKLPF